MQTSEGAVIVIFLVVAQALLSGCDKRQQYAFSSIDHTAALIGRSRVGDSRTELTGRNPAYSVSEVRPQVTGMIQRSSFATGSRVNGRKVLYNISPSPCQSALNSAKANLKNPEAHLDMAQFKVEVYKTSLGQNSIDRMDYYEDGRLRGTKAHTLSYSSDPEIKWRPWVVFFTGHKGPMLGHQVVSANDV